MKHFRVKAIVVAILLFAATGIALSANLGSMVYENYGYTNITTATTTYVSSSPGVLAGILVNGGTLGAITVVDNTATTAGNTVATIASPTAGQVIPFGISMDVGICVVTAAATNVTVIWKKK